MEKLYIRKSNKRYKDIGYQFTGFPAEGVWFVQKRNGGSEARHIMQVGELPSPMTLAKLEPYRQLIGSIIVKYLKQCSEPFTVEDVSSAVFKAIAEEEEKARLNMVKDEETNTFVAKAPVAMAPEHINAY